MPVSHRKRARGVHAEDLSVAIPALGSGMFTLEAVRMRDLFRHSTVAALSVFRDDRTTAENFAEQARLADCLLRRRIAHMAVVGEWPGVGERGLLLREVTQEQVRAIAAEFGLGTYLWAVRGRWAVCDTGSNRALAVGEALRIGGPEVGWMKAIRHPETGALVSARTTLRTLGPDNEYARFRRAQKKAGK